MMLSATTLCDSHSEAGLRDKPDVTSLQIFAITRTVIAAIRRERRGNQREHAAEREQKRREPFERVVLQKF